MNDQARRFGPASSVRPGVPAVRALERGIAILRAFSAAQSRLTLTAVARVTGLDKGTARRLLHTLEMNGLVEHDPHTGQYALSAGVLEIASGVETGRDLRDIAAPYLPEIVERTGATAFLWVLHEGMALCIERVTSTHIKIDTPWFRVGTRAPVNCGAGPRVLLAFADDADRDLALLQPLSARTVSSETNPLALRRAGDEIRARGYEFAIDDYVVGLAGIGVPVLTHAGRLIGAVSVSGLTGALQAELAEHIAFMQAAARTIGRKAI